MATNNTLYVFDNYTPNVFPVRGPLITTPYEQYPYLEHPSKTKAASQGQFDDGYLINCTTYNSPFELYIPNMTHSYGDERYQTPSNGRIAQVIPSQEQPLDLATNLLPAHPWLGLNGCQFKFVLNSVSNAARQHDMSIGDAFDFVVLSRSTGLLVLKHKTVPVSYIWQRSVSATIAFLTLQFPGFEFSDLTFELRASTPSYGTVYSPLGFLNYALSYERYTDRSLFPHSVYSITKVE
jgi:hypothetical protein